MENNETVELSQEELQDAKAQLRDDLEAKKNGNIEDVKLASETKEEEPRVYANVFKDVEALKKGIQNLKADVPEYMLNGMNDDALEQYYTDLRKEFSSRKPEPKVEDKKVDEDNKPKQVSTELWQELDKTFTETGSVTDEQIAQLDKLGIPKQVVDSYIAGLTAKQAEFTNQLIDIAGGVDEYNAMKEWAENTYSQEELDMITSGTNAEIMFKLKGLKAEYTSLFGSNNTKQNYDRMRGITKSTTEGYTSQEEWMMDRKDVRYRKDARYKAKVDAKFKASKFAS